jgi:hypothetical protein
VKYWEIIADIALVLLVRDCVFLQLSITVHLNMSDSENGQWALAKRTIRSRISSERWEQIKTAYAAAIMAVTLTLALSILEDAEQTVIGRKRFTYQKELERFPEIRVALLGKYLSSRAEFSTTSRITLM